MSLILWRLSRPPDISVRALPQGFTSRDIVLPLPPLLHPLRNIPITALPLYCTNLNNLCAGYSCTTHTFLIKLYAKCLWCVVSRRLSEATSISFYCYDLEFSVLFLSMFLFIHSVSLSVLSSLAFCHIHALVFPSHVSVFLFDLSPNTSRVCVCTIRLLPEFWYLRKTLFTSRFLEFPAAVLICIVSSSPQLCSF